MLLYRPFFSFFRLRLNNLAMAIRRCVRRVRAPFDAISMQAKDLDKVVTCCSTADICILAWLLPQPVLQRLVHRRYDVETIFETDAQGPLGIVSIAAGRSTPKQQSTLERFLDPPPHQVLSVRLNVVDKFVWQRTHWSVTSLSSSKSFGLFPQRAFGALHTPHPVQITSSFDTTNNRFDKYEVCIPGLNFFVSLKDLNRTVLDGPIVEGFLDNESALKLIGHPFELNYRGVSGSIYRQPMWITPFSPNVAEVMQLETGTFFKDIFGEEPVGAPLCAWLVDRVPETKIYQAESQAEFENDEYHLTSQPRGAQVRVQRRATNRYESFRDGLRRRAYSDINEEEAPR